METIKLRKRSLWIGAIPVVLAIAMILVSTAGVAAAFDRWGTRIKTVGSRVSADQAERPNVLAIVSGDRMLYYDVAQVFDNEGRSALNRLPFNRIQVMGSNDAFDKLARTATCEPVELDMILYNATSTAAFMRVEAPSAESWATATSRGTSCG